MKSLSFSESMGKKSVILPPLHRDRTRGRKNFQETCPLHFFPQPDLAPHKIQRILWERPRGPFQGVCQLPGDELACLMNQQGVGECPPCSFRCPSVWGSLSWRGVRIEGWGWEGWKGIMTGKENTQGVWRNQLELWQLDEHYRYSLMLSHCYCLW